MTWGDIATWGAPVTWSGDSGGLVTITAVPAARIAINDTTWRRP